jgi:AcrR family transcriptional regulator
VNMVQSEVPKRRRVKAPEERRQDILEAALELFRDRGFDETTVQDIATAAGVAAGTVYLYFPSKEHVLVALHNRFNRGMGERFGEVWASFAERADAGEEIDRREVIDSLIDTLVAYALDHKEAVNVMMRFVPRLHSEPMEEALLSDHALDQLMAAGMREAMEKGRVHSSDPEMTTMIVNAGINNTIGHAIAFGDPPDLDRVVAQAKEIYYKVLAPEVPVSTPPGQERRP